MESTDLGFLGELIVACLAGLLIWFLVRIVRNQPEAFSKVNLSKSFGTLGWLAIGLIAFIALCILLLRQT
jgi:cell division protein FtsW (lipid II flippase)